MGTDRCAVEHRHDVGTSRLAERPEGATEYAGVRPAPEAHVNRVPSSVSFRHPTPGAAVHEHVKHGFKGFPVSELGRLRRSGQVRFHGSELGIGEARHIGDSPSRYRSLNVNTT